MKIKVSVIIPVYNAEKYLSECIDSLLNQSLKECEFIFVNDGSHDKSKEIIESYRIISNKIRLINQKNRGVSAARNVGLKIASGEYIGFVDADDSINTDMFETLYNKGSISNCDVVISNIISQINDKKLITKYSFPENTIINEKFIKNEILTHLIKSDNFNSVVNKIFKSSILKSRNVMFPENVVLGEDGLFNINFFKIASSAIYIDYAGYNYREVEGSATRNISEKDYFKRVLEIYSDNITESLLPHLEKEKIKKLKSMKFINNILSIIHIYLSPSKDINLIKRYKYVENMIGNSSTIEALSIFYKENYDALGRYEKFIIKMIEKKFTLGIYCAVFYSRFRNRY
ncbi:glycosyltransferase family 2 protein [Bacillus sp. UMB0893]|uniref:glycosyltransferase family 2 protein n=1 Tax=Bacillus sp. UMB0893 TaxID=2066053 RepID=UPI000C75F669|nr:glycosyltransferase [Bacillus sp. UMB0893]PLR68735.1 glycosyl transferase family 2 [Bacillus sp. UMB0893]